MLTAYPELYQHSTEKYSQLFTICKFVCCGWSDDDDDDDDDDDATINISVVVW